MKGTDDSVSSKSSDWLTADRVLLRLADWLHLSNPDDPSRPIIGQVFKCYISEERSVVAIVKVFAVLIDPSAVHGRASLG